jgi:hypothetical protein
VTIYKGRRSREHYEDQEEERRRNTRLIIGKRNVIWTLRKEKKWKQKMNNGKEEQDKRFDGGEQTGE